MTYYLLFQIYCIKNKITKNIIFSNETLNILFITNNFKM